MSANQRTAGALNVYTLLGEYDNQLETAAEPYGWIIRLKDDVSAVKETALNSKMESVAYILIASIGNLDHVSYEYTADGEARTQTYDAAGATAFFGQDIKDCGSSISLLNELIEETGL